MRTRAHKSARRYKLGRVVNRKKLIKMCDDLFRECIRARDKVCQKTGRKDNLQVAHFYTRSNLRIRWDFDNAVLLNGGTHLWWAHKHPYEFVEWWKKRLGGEKFELLNIKSRVQGPVKTFDIQMLVLDLKQKLEYFKSEPS